MFCASPGQNFTGAPIPTPCLQLGCAKMLHRAHEQLRDAGGSPGAHGGSWWWSEVAGQVLRASCVRCVLRSRAARCCAAGPTTRALDHKGGSHHSHAAAPPRLHTPGPHGPNPAALSPTPQKCVPAQGAQPRLALGMNRILLQARSSHALTCPASLTYTTPAPSHAPHAPHAWVHLRPCAPGSAAPQRACPWGMATAPATWLATLARTPQALHQ